MVMATRTGNCQTQKCLTHGVDHVVKTIRYMVASHGILHDQLKDFLHGKPKDKKGKKASHESGQLNELQRKTLQEYAQQKGLQVELFERWVLEMRAAYFDSYHALHFFSRAGAKSAKMPGQPKNYLKGSEVIVDYSDFKNEDWVQEGFSFGSGPGQTAELSLRGAALQPLIDIACYPQARFEPLWQRLKVIGGRAGPTKVVQAGKTICTPTFTVNKRYIHALVKGAGHAFVEVDSHRQLAGPLHTKNIRRSWDRPSDAYHWVVMDLGWYVGKKKSNSEKWKTPPNQAHIEFTPKDDHFSVVMVLQSNSRSFKQFPVFNNILKDRVNKKSLNTQELALLYQDVLIEGFDKFEKGQLSEQNNDHAVLINWIVNKKTLLPGDNKNKLQ